MAKSQEDVRSADNKMISVMKNAQAKGLDSIYNTTQGLRLIQAKSKLEGMAGKSFVDYGPGKGEEKDRPLVAAKLTELQQEGFGKPPGHQLKKKMLRMCKGKKNKVVKHQKGDGIGDIIKGGIGKLMMGLVKKFLVSGY
jgi:hypothetical protein